MKENRTRRRIEVVEIFKYLTGFLEEREQKNWKWFTALGSIRAVIDVFGFYMTVYFINKISGNPELAGGLRAIVIVLMFFSEVVIELYRCRISNHFLYHGAQQLSMKVFELFAKEDRGHHNQKSVMQALEIVRNDTMKSMNIILTFVAVGVNIFTLAGYAAVLIFISKWIGIGIITGIIFFMLIVAVCFFYRTQMKMYGEKCRKYAIKANAQITLEYGVFERSEERRVGKEC